MAKKRILTQDEIDRYMNNLDKLSELSEDGLEYSDDDIDFLPDCVSSIEDSDSDSENSVGSQNTIQNMKKSDDDNKLDRNISMAPLQFRKLRFLASVQGHQCRYRFERGTFRSEHQYFIDHAKTKTGFT
ncbi:hypothetical protein TNCV_4655851 [Trichonephila clavipes]|nr:hypothetical protein TNCV_4655851 [Trichonephila clavipes]